MSLNKILFVALSLVSISSARPIPVDNNLVPAAIAEAVGALEHDNNYQLVETYAHKVKGKEAVQFLLLLEQAATIINKVKNDRLNSGILPFLLRITIFPAIAYGLYYHPELNTVRYLAMQFGLLDSVNVKKSHLILGDFLTLQLLCSATDLALAFNHAIQYSVRNGDLQLARIKQLRDIVIEQLS